LPFTPADVCLEMPFENGHFASLDMMSPIGRLKKLLVKEEVPGRIPADVRRIQR
jgi:hypothetical protein